MAADVVEFKAGSTFSAALDLSVTVDGVLQADLTGWTGASQLRHRGGQLVADLAFAWLDAAAGTCVVSAADTSGWPVALLDIDVLLTAPGGVRVATPTWTIKVIRGPTHA